MATDKYNINAELAICFHGDIFSHYKLKTVFIILFF